MKTITVALGERAYPIAFCEGLISRAEPAHLEVLLERVGQSVFVVTNSTVAPLFLDGLLSKLSGKKCGYHCLPDGEQFKTLEEVEGIIGQLIEQGFTRDSTMIALGGGVVGDVAGFAAAIFQRGIPIIQIPTTLLSQVDSSVGGKTAVNHPLGKNMLGAFHQPSLVVIDVATLTSLNPREYAAGLAEIVKHAALADSDYFEWLEANIELIIERDLDCLAEMIAKSCHIKAEIVAEDETEQGRRGLLNLGHTFGHAIETLSGYGQVLHGKAVAISLLMAADYSVRDGYIAQTVKTRLHALLSGFGLPVVAPSSLPVDLFKAAMARDKKATQAGMKLIVLQALGKAEILEDVDLAVLDETLADWLL